MVSIREKIKNLEKADVNKILDKCLTDLVDFIVELNKTQLYDKGEIDVTNPARREHYAASTIKAKKKKAQYKKTDFVTLRWSGDLYGGFELEIAKDYFLIRTSDPKRSFLFERSKNFGDRFVNALGLTEKSKTELRKEILPVIIEKLKNEL